MAEAQGDSEQEKLRCPICLETFASPKVLKCLHTFCEKCIHKYARDQGEMRTPSDTIVCPICRTPTPAPATNQTSEDWAAKLPTNSTVLANITMKDADNDDTVLCQPCFTDGKDKRSVSYCVTCSEYLCKICYDHHKKFKVSKDHTITLKSVTENPSLLETKDTLFRCSKHMKKYTYVCIQDRDLCCSKCAITDHRFCKDLLLIENVAETYKNGPETRKTLENLETLRNMFMALLENRSSNFETIQQQKTDIATQITECAKEIKELTDKLETATLENLEQVYKQEALTISDQIVECKSAIAAVETSKKMLYEQTKADGDDTKTFMTTTRVSQQVGRYLQKYDVAHNNFMKIQIQFQRDKTLEGIIRSLNSLGQVLSETSKIPRLSPDRSYEKAMMLLPRVQSHSMIIFNAKVPHDQNSCILYSGVFLLDDRFVLCDQGNKKLKLFDKCFHCVSYLVIRDEPRFICRVNIETVALTTSRQRIHIVLCANELTEHRTIEVGNDCYGIASCEHNIIIDTLQEQHSILIYDKSYNLIKIIQRPVPLSFLNNKSCISPDGQTIHYTTRDNIITTDINGKVLNTFESNDLKKPLGITIDKYGILYCCGHHSSTVVQVTSEGRQLNVLLSRDHGLKNPLGVVLNDSNNVILVLENKSNEVKVFKLI